MKQIKNTKCKNCGFSFPKNLQSNYCSSCGQENESPRRPILHYFLELCEGILHIDNRTFRSLYTLLFIPGKITKEYLFGKRSKYSPPLRMLILSSAFYLFNVVFIHHINQDQKEQHTSIREHFDKEFKDSSNIITFSIGFDKIKLRLLYLSASKCGEFQHLPKNKIGAWLEKENLPADIFHRLYFEALHNRMNSRLEEGEYIKTSLNSQNIITLLTLPVTAFLIFIFYYNKQLYYYDTLIYSMHYFTWTAIFNSIYLWISVYFISLFASVEDIPYSLFIYNSVFLILSSKRAFDFKWWELFLRCIPLIVTLYLFYCLKTVLVEIFFV